MFQSFDSFYDCGHGSGSSVRIVLGYVFGHGNQVRGVARGQLTRTSRQAPACLLHFLVGGKVAGVGLGHAFLDFVDLPFIHADIFLNRLGGDQ